MERESMKMKVGQNPDSCYLCINLGKPTCPDHKNDCSPHYGCKIYISEAQFLNDNKNKLPKRVKCVYCGSYNTHLAFGKRFQCADCGDVFER